MILNFVFIIQAYNSFGVKSSFAYLNFSVNASCIYTKLSGPRISD